MPKLNEKHLISWLRKGVDHEADTDYISGCVGAIGVGYRGAGGYFFQYGIVFCYCFGRVRCMDLSCVCQQEGKKTNIHPGPIEMSSSIS